MSHAGRRGTVTLALFRAASGALVYTYLGFPALVFLRGLLAPRGHRSGEITPPVSLVIAAHNEAETIGEKLENLLTMDYGPFETIVASDGSDDGTDDIVRRYSSAGVRLLSLPRTGKAGALNAAVAAASNDIVVFSDANSIYAADALRALVRPLADPRVGGVVGNQRNLREPGAGAIAVGEQRYWDFDRLLKQAQSRAGNAISATGAIYAVRRELIDPIPEGVTDDFFTSTGVIARGRRLVFAADAVAYEPVASTGGAEFGRKVRVMTRGLCAVMARRELLNPRRHGFYALQLLSHKILRRLMAFPLVALAATTPLLWRRGWFYRAATVGQAVFYGLAGLGLVRPGDARGWRRVVALPSYFCMVNAASLRAVYNVVRGRRINRWEPQRTAVAAPDGQ